MFFVNYTTTRREREIDDGLIQGRNEGSSGCSTCAINNMTGLGQIIIV